MANGRSFTYVIRFFLMCQLDSKVSIFVVIRGCATGLVQLTVYRCGVPFYTMNKARNYCI